MVGIVVSRQHESTFTHSPATNPFLPPSLRQFIDGKTVFHLQIMSRLAEEHWGPIYHSLEFTLPGEHKLVAR